MPVSLRFENVLICRMKIALAQLNLIVGDLSGNAKKILDAATSAAAANADLLVTPELSICGYPPEDLLLRPAFVNDCEAAVTALAKLLPLPTVIGTPWRKPSGLVNGAALARAGLIECVYGKQELPNYAVFDEKRYFVSDHAPQVFELNGCKIGLLICEDIWFSRAAAASKSAGAQLLIAINGSPYHTAQHDARLEVVRARVNETRLPMLYVNMVGGQDELVFDGGSMVVDAQGELAQRLPFFSECVAISHWRVDAHGAWEPQRVRSVDQANTTANVYAALVLAVRDYINKNGFPGIVLGLSGGIDSAVVLAIAVDALGKNRVRAVMLPSKFNASISLEDARWMAGTTGVRYDEIDIEPMYDAFEAALQPQFVGYNVDATEENLQSRIRGTLLMALSNKTGTLVLTTGNKSEMSTGYATLYGDMAGGFGVLKDCDKELVYALANYRNALGRVIPERVITRAPSAELRHDQKDQDSLPPYEILDRIMELYVEQNKSVQEIVALGLAVEDVKKVVRLIKINEYKRRQAPTGPRITPRGYGRDWRYPITSGYRDWNAL
jgi:NAD+ synthase (glutamine-hydrolysing)